MTQAIGPTSQQRLTPYVSTDMVKYHRKRGIRLDDLVPAGSVRGNDSALFELIEEASSRADSIMQGIVAATLDTVLERVNINRRGYADVHPRYRPVIGVTAVSLGGSPSTLQALSSLAGVGVQAQSFSVPTGPLLTSNQGPIQFGGVGVPMDQAWIQYTYANGFPVTELTAAVAAGATSVDVLDTTGIIGGATYLTIYAGQNRCRVLATSVSTAPALGMIGTGPGTVGVSAVPFAIDDIGPYPTAVSALPPDIVTAVTLLIRAISKTSGGGNVTAQTTTGNRKNADPYGAGDDFAEAGRLLAPYTVQRA